jgi:hypothetical protein
MSKLTKDKRDKLLIVGIATAFVTCGLYFLVIGEQREQITSCEEKIARAAEAMGSDERWIRQAAAVREKLEAQLKEIESLQTEMAPADKFKWFYSTVEGVRTLHDVSLVDITPQPELGEVGVLANFPYRAATFGVKFNATYHGFGSFVADFENRFPNMRVQNLRIEADPTRKLAGTNAVLAAGADGGERLAMTFKVVTLVKPTTPL